MIKHVFVVQHGDIIETVYRGATHYNGQIVHLTDAGAVDAIYESRAAARIAAIKECTDIEAEYHTKALDHAAMIGMESPE